MSRDQNECCPHCEHFVDWHQGLPFNGGTHGEWRYRCTCGCTVNGDLIRLDPHTFEPCGQPEVTR